ncbi:MAG: Flp family type IVb pilin [Pseudolabrys sp.]
MDFRFRSALSRFADDTRGATAIEYSLIAGGIACAIAATLTTLGASVRAMWETLAGLMP